LGNIFYKNSLKTTNIIRRAEFETTLKLDSLNNDWIDIKAVCILSDQSLIVSTSDNLVLFDPDFNITKIINELEGHKFICYGLATNTKNKIYVTNILNNKLIVTDYDFNIVKSFGDLDGSEENQFNRPKGLCFHENLYICDANNKRVKIYSENLNYIRSVYVNFKPFNIKITSSTAFLIGEKSWAFIYDINNNWTLKHAFDLNFFDNVVEFSEIDSYFYLIFNKTTIKCFDSNGLMINQISFKKIINYFTDLKPIGLLCLEEKFIILYSNEGRFIKFRSDN
jgi:hypothetical protein